MNPPVPLEYHKAKGGKCKKCCIPRHILSYKKIYKSVCLHFFVNVKILIKRLSVQTLVLK